MANRFISSQCEPSEKLPDLKDSELMEIDFHYFVDELEEEFRQFRDIDKDHFSIPTIQRG